MKSMTPDQINEVWDEKKVLGATIVYPQDQCPVLLTRVGRAGNTIWFIKVKSVDSNTGHQPARYEGPFPVWDHTYSEDELVRLGQPSQEPRIARWSEARQCYLWYGTPVHVGDARYYRNYSY